MLGLEEQKETARGQLEAAAHSQDVELLEDALEEVGRLKGVYKTYRILSAIGYSYMCIAYESFS